MPFGMDRNDLRRRKGGGEVGGGAGGRGRWGRRVVATEREKKTQHVIRLGPVLFDYIINALVRREGESFSWRRH